MQNNLPSADELAATYARVTFGYDEPDYMVILTPCGNVTLTPKAITGSKRAIKWVEKKYGLAANKHLTDSPFWL